MSDDLGNGYVDNIHRETGLPTDSWGHLLDPTDSWSGDIVSNWDQKDTKLRNLTNPYGFLHFAIGDGDDFHCYDYNIIKSDKGRFIILHATCNSETGSFIQGAGYRVINIDTPEGREDAAQATLDMVDEGCDWEGATHDKSGWNQDPYYFYRTIYCEVHKDRIGQTTYTDRQKRFGGKRINKFCRLDFLNR